MDATINHNKFQVLYMYQRKRDTTYHNTWTTPDQVSLIWGSVSLGSLIEDPFQFEGRP